MRPVRHASSSAAIAAIMTMSLMVAMRVIGRRLSSTDERSETGSDLPTYRPSPLKLRRANVSEATEALAKAASLMRAAHELQHHSAAAPEWPRALSDALRELSHSRPVISANAGSRTIELSRSRCQAG